MKKYLFVVPSLSKGGAEKVVSILSSNLVEKKRKAVVITHFRTNGDYKIHPNVKIICLSNLIEEEYRKKMSIVFLLKLLFRLRKNIKIENPDYILPFLWTTCIRTEIALLFSKYKERVIQTVRNNPDIFPKQKILRRYRNFLIFKSKKTIVQNEDQKKYFNKKIQKKIFVLANPVAKELFEIEKKKHKNYNIIGVGRLEEQKNFELLINSFYEVSKNRNDIYLKIYGEGSKKEKLQNLIDNLNISDIVSLEGRKNNYEEIYSLADIYVLSSKCEGMPNTLLEAMSVGLACIATDCPTGPRDIIDNNIDGILIENENKEEMVKALNKVLENKKVFNEISKNCKKKMREKYLPENICERLINICEEGE